MSPTMAQNEDIYYQYSDGKSLLHATVVERDQLLRELEAVARAPQGTGEGQKLVRFDVAGAQSLLFELSIKAERIDSLIIQINSYAERCGMPLVD